MESTAAATAYGLLVSGQKHILVVDMGGGTTDLSIMHIDERGGFAVKTTGGNNQLGGNHIDECVLQLLKQKCATLPSGEQ